MTVRLKECSMMKPEKQVQSEIMKYVRSHGGYCIKVIKANENGVSDLLMGIEGLFISCEVKAEKYENDPWKHASSWQKLQIKRVQDASCIGMVVASLEQFKEALSEHGIYL